MDDLLNNEDFINYLNLLIKNNKEEEFINNLINKINNIKNNYSEIDNNYYIF